MRFSTQKWGGITEPLLCGEPTDGGIDQGVGEKIKNYQNRSNSAKVTGFQSGVDTFFEKHD